MADWSCRRWQSAAAEQCGVGCGPWRRRARPRWSAPQPAATSCGGQAAPQRQGQDEHLSGGLDPVAWGRGGGVSSPVRHGSHRHHSLPVPPAQASAASSSSGHPPAGALLPSGSTADRLLLGSDLPRGRLGGAAALERVEPPAGSQRRAPVAGSACLSSWASASCRCCNQAWRRSPLVTR